MTRIVIVEAEAALRQSLIRTLTFEGYSVAGARDGRAALRQIVDGEPDLVITDIHLPVMSGLELVGALRANPGTRLIPIIVLTGDHDRASHRRCMEAGADDYLTKPFQIDELIGAISAQIRRSRWWRGMEAADDGREVVEFAHWRYDVARRILTAKDGSGVERRLTLSEARLLMVLLDRPGRTIERQELLDRMGRPAASPLDRSVDVFITHLRQKIEHDARNPMLLKTVRSVGYVLDLDREQVRRYGAVHEEA